MRGIERCCRNNYFIHVWQVSAETVCISNYIYIYSHTLIHHVKYSSTDRMADTLKNYSILATACLVEPEVLVVWNHRHGQKWKRNRQGVELRKGEASSTRSGNHLLGERTWLAEKSPLFGRRYISEWLGFPLGCNCQSFMWQFLRGWVLNRQAVMKTLVVCCI